MKKSILSLFPLIMSVNLAYASNYQDSEKLEVQPTTLSYKFLATDLDGQPVDALTIMANLSRVILDNTAYPTIAKKAPCSRWSSEEKCAIRTGTYITIGKDKIIVEYHNVKNDAGAITAKLVESDVYNNLSFTLPIKVTQEESYLVAKVIVPDTVEINASNMSLTRHNPLAKPIELRDNLISIIQPNKVELTKYHLAQGEIDNQYSVDSVHGNLGRLLGKYDWHKFPICDTNDKIIHNATSGKEISTLDIKTCKPTGIKLTDSQRKAQEEFIESKWDINTDQIMNTYRYKLHGNYIPINVAAYPYRNQSKAVYKAIIPYVMSSDGGINLDSTQVTTIVKAIESAVSS